MTESPQDAIKALRDALAQPEVTPGPWHAIASKLGNDFAILTADRKHVLAEVFSDIRAAGEYSLREAGRNAQYIAACHPERIRALLAHVERLEDERYGVLRFCRDVQQNGTANEQSIALTVARLMASPPMIGATRDPDGRKHQSFGGG
jgi:hypothetical protein